MSKEKVLVVGLGEVGIPLYELLKETAVFDVYGLDIDKEKTRRLNQAALPSSIDIMHICVPCISRQKLVNTTTDYIKQYAPKLVIIESTVSPQTTMDVHMHCKPCLVAHSPIRGVHKSVEHMKWEIRRWTKYVGGATPDAAQAARKHFEKMGLKTKVLKSSLETELGKLYETTYRAWMIICFQEMHRIARHLNANFDDAVDFLADTHCTRLDRPIMYPGEIAGHCLMPNVNLLLSSYDSEMLKMILKSNKKRKQELKDADVRREAEEVKKKAEAIQKDLMEKCDGK